MISGTELPSPDEMASSLWKKHVQLFDEEVKKHRNLEGILLDGGCGSEHFLKRYSKDFKTCIGIDFEFGEFAINTEKVQYIRGDLEKIPLKSGIVDVFLTNFVLEHIKNPEIFFKEVRRVTKKGGAFISWTPNANAPSGLFLRIVPFSIVKKLKKMLLKKKAEFPTYYRANTVSKLDGFLGYAGFTHEAHEMIDGVFYLSNIGLVRWLHGMYIRLTNSGGLRNFKDIIFVGYVKAK